MSKASQYRHMAAECFKMAGRMSPNMHHATITSMAEEFLDLAKREDSGGDAAPAVDSGPAAASGARQPLPCGTGLIASATNW
jgi:hypothetical protein